MYKYNKILVGLDNSDIDADLIKATSSICELSGSKKVFFVNILREMNLPDQILREFPDLLTKALEEREAELHEKVKANFKFTEVELVVKVLVDQGQVTKTLLKFASEEKTDLVVLGRKNEKKGGGILLSRMARRLACSLLIMPKGSQLKMKKVLVPTDFSDYSRRALEKAAILVKRAHNDATICIQNVYQVPVGYHYTGKSFKEFSEIMKAHAKTDYDKFIQTINPNGLKIEALYTLDKNDDVITEIYKTARKIKSDLIIIGAKGRTATASLLIGSKAEKLVQLDSEIPLLVVRPKGKIAGVMETIKDI